MKKTRLVALYPMNKGLDRNSVPGTQDPRALKVAKNIILGTRGSLKKRPGLRKIPYIGNNDGVQAATQLFATVSNSQASEVIRVRKGKVGALRQTPGPDAQFVTLQQEDSAGVVTDFTVSDTDAVTFGRAGNALILFFENTRPYRYTIGANLKPLEILASHFISPPTFGRYSEFRFFYSGRRAAPHTLYMSSPNTITDYTLLNGGGSFRVNDGDGDYVGLTAISPPFRGALWLFKWENLYRFARSGYGYGWDQQSDETGAVHQNAVTASKTDIYFVDTAGIHSLSATLAMGGGPETTLTWPIYEYFQESVNWSAAKSMILMYDKSTATLLLSYAKGGSFTNNAVLGMNVFTKEFFEWNDCEYPSIGKYTEYGRRMAFVADNERGFCVLDPKVFTLDGDPISVEVGTGTVFPTRNPKAVVGFCQAWLITKPTLLSSDVTVHYSIDGKREVKTTVDMSGKGYGSVIADTLDAGGSLIGGSGIIGKMDTDLVTIPFPFVGEGSSVSFRVTHDPPAEDADQAFELMGILYEIETNLEDSEQKESA